MSNNKKIIFVSGTGRSGTHLIGRAISSHKDIYGRIETPDTFGLITKIATTQDTDAKLKTYALKKLLKYRLNKVLKNSEKYILEKSHPSLWLVDFLSKEFDAKFIFVYRDVEPTVSSMLEHKGVLAWFDQLPLNKPNRFLGITKSNLEGYKDLSIEEKCAIRWQSHYNEIHRLKSVYPNNVQLIKYDEFLTNPEPLIKQISNFLSIVNKYDIEEFKIDSLDKWKTKLSKDQLEKIASIVK